MSRDADAVTHTARRPRAAAVIVAGGLGSRFGNPGGKQLVPLAGRPLLAWTIEAFDRAECIEHIVVVCPAERRDEYAAAAVTPYAFATPISFAACGAERQDSTRAGVAAAPAGFDCVAIHDGARPLIRPATIDAAVERLALESDIDGVVCGQPSIDTLKLADTAGHIEATPDRSRYWCVQTPQVFWRDTVMSAYDAAAAEGFLGTDDASLVERAGGRVLLLDTPRDNMKVTVPEDLALVEAILASRRG